MVRLVQMAVVAALMPVQDFWINDYGLTRLKQRLDYPNPCVDGLIHDDASRLDTLPVPSKL